uniref:Uncharacterized protein n=1 Tax=mine drainage metagenome TaxID=410659 RepID=E6QW77_9ZZZZ
MEQKKGHQPHTGVVVSPVGFETYETFVALRCVCYGLFCRVVCGAIVRYFTESTSHIINKRL